MLKHSVNELIGSTPLLELNKIKKVLGLKANIYAKLECFNPGGSAKDRVAASIINTYEKEGLLKEGSVIIEPTSGNTGIGLSMLGSSKGYRVIIVMPDTMSIERQLLMKAFGADLVLTDGKLGMAGAIAKAEALHSEIPDSIIAGQFTNPANPEAHYMTTGPEIYSDLNSKVDVFIAGAGTGGTITGTGKYLKENNPYVHIIAVEPENSQVLAGGKPGPHNLQGIGAGFIPEILDTTVIDEVMPVSDESAYEAARLLAKCEGILTGITSGAALSAGLKCASMDIYEGKNIVVLLPDTGDRYLSTALYNN